MIEFIHYGRVKPKERPRVGRGGFVYTPKGTQSSEQSIVKSFKDVYIDFKPYEKPVYMEITFGYKVADSLSSKKKLELLNMLWSDKLPDVDNIAKTVCDALNGYAYKDDKQIAKLLVKKVYASEFYLEVKVEEL